MPVPDVVGIGPVRRPVTRGEHASTVAVGERTALLTVHQSLSVSGVGEDPGHGHDDRPEHGFTQQGDAFGVTDPHPVAVRHDTGVRRVHDE